MTPTMMRDDLTAANERWSGWEPIVVPAASLKSLLYNIRASLELLPNGVDKAIGVGSLDVLEERLASLDLNKDGA